MFKVGHTYSTSAATREKIVFEHENTVYGHDERSVTGKACLFPYDKTSGFTLLKGSPERRLFPTSKH